MLTPFYLEVRQTGNKKNGQQWSDGTAQHGEISGGFAPVCYTTESVKSLARRFGFNDCSFGQFIRRQFPELHEQHQKLVRQMKKTD